MTNLERAIKKRGAVKVEEFTSHAGESGNCKLELDGEFLKANPKLAGEIACRLAVRLETYQPEIIVPVPAGANLLGEMIAKEMGIGCVTLKKLSRDEYGFKSEKDRLRIVNADAIGLVDDVFRTGSALSEVSKTSEFVNKVAVAGVIWDRSHPASIKNFPFEVESLVQRYVPLRVGQVS
jgi:orotate phosphoribosyltransferase-like protein